jgi:hypothetical protein
MSQSMRNYLSVFLTTAGGALITYVSKALADGTLPTDAAAWRTLGTGALIAVAASLIHLYQSPPGTVSVPVDTGKPVQP